MGKYACRCPIGRIGREHDDRCPAGQLQEWAASMLGLRSLPEHGDESEVEEGDA